MGWFGKKFDFYLLFGDAIEGCEPWRRNGFLRNAEPTLRKIVGLSPGAKNTGVRVLEYAFENDTDKYMSKVKLGRLKWDERSHEKWTLAENDQRKFHHLASWTPVWTVCEKTGEAPDVYISLINEHYLGENRAYQFDFLFTIAVSSGFSVSSRELVMELAMRLKVKRAVHTVRPWVRGSKDERGVWKLARAINDTWSFGIYAETENIHSIPFDEIQFEPYWKVLM